MDVPTPDALAAPTQPPSRSLGSPHPLKLLAVALLIGAAGLLAYRISEHAGMREQRNAASHRLDLFAAAVDGVVNRYAHIPSALELNPDVASLLRWPTDGARRATANHYLERLNALVGSIALFVLDPHGIVLAASNWNQPDSFIGEDLAFRSYFQQALAGETGRHFAVGTTRGDPGYFVAHPLREDGRVVGVAVIKIGLDGLRDTWRSLGTPALIADHNKVVILASVEPWLYTALAPLSPLALAEIERTRLYHDRPLGRFPFAITPALEETGVVVEVSRRDFGLQAPTPGSAAYLAQGRRLAANGWQLVVFSDLRLVRNQAVSHAALAMIATGFVLLFVAFLAQRRRILRQKLEAKALLEKANRELEATVARRTEALTQANVLLRKEIGEREQAELTLRAAQDELVQAAKLAVLGQLATGITHELNQPLGAIRTLAGNALEFLRRGDQPTAEKNLGIVTRLADQMGSIITPLKTFARKSPAIPARVDVAHAVANALVLLDARLQRSEVRVDNRCTAGAVIAWCDQNRLEQVLINLIGNAADAMREQPGRVLTLSAAAQDDDTVTLTVADTGPGLPERVRAHLFEPFFTTKPPGEGLGLGLAISRDIVRDFGGDLAADNLPAGGACFTLRLPAFAARAPA